MQGVSLALEAASPDSNSASRFLTEIRRRSIEKCCYRGKIISLCCGGESVEFHKFTPVAPEDIILPPETKDMLQRNTVRFFQNADVLLRSGRSLKRGILLHGKPGTGKTYTAKWLGQSLQGVTVVLITTEQLGMVKESCQLARMLAPSLVIMEDVDLIASERDDSRHPAYQVTLHQIMNEMDGIDSEAAVIFLLTTNRPDFLESAIASRPGRIDQAIEFPLPDEDCRQKLIDLYGRGLTLQLENPSEIVSKIKGASPAFIKEFVRKASMFAAEEETDTNGTITVVDRHLELALKELVFGGGSLTRNLLGFDVEDADSLA
jgi:SpoVK/Ycf46/Vps4 family AAA+-type ATPase